jgi:hypothetical protein
VGESARVRLPDQPLTSLVALQEALTFAFAQLGPAALGYTIRDQAIGTSSTPIAHGLTAQPRFVMAFPQSDARVWRSAVSDDRRVWLQASSATTADVLVVP